MTEMRWAADIEEIAFNKKEHQQSLIISDHAHMSQRHIHSDTHVH